MTGSASRLAALAAVSQQQNLRSVAVVLRLTTTPRHISIVIVVRFFISSYWVRLATFAKIVFPKHKPGSAVTGRILSDA